MIMPEPKFIDQICEADQCTFLYDGANLVAEYNSSGTVLRRYVPSGLGGDQPLVWYEGSDESSPRWLHTDNQGSVVGYSDGSGHSGATYGYDPYGLPDATNGWAGLRYRYTGQIMIPEASLYYYKNRVYDPALGRFLQTDPIGYVSDVNPYTYVGNDAVNGEDPTGLEDPNQDTIPNVPELIVTAARSFCDQNPQACARIQLLVNTGVTVPKIVLPNLPADLKNLEDAVNKLHTKVCNMAPGLQRGLRATGHLSTALGNVTAWGGVGGVAGGFVIAGTGALAFENPEIGLPVTALGLGVMRVGGQFLEIGEQYSQTGSIISAFGGDFSGIATDPLSSIVGAIIPGAQSYEKSAISHVVESATDGIAEAFNCPGS